LKNNAKLIDLEVLGEIEEDEEKDQEENKDNNE